MVTVEEIVRAYLIEHGYDGLYSEEGGCACRTECLFCCDEIKSDCRAGHLQTVPVNSEYEYMISSD